MHVPHELIIQILLRLPVKSLIHFKCVRKLWFSLISNDSHFANSHFQLTVPPLSIFLRYAVQEGAKLLEQMVVLDW